MKVTCCFLEKEKDSWMYISAPDPETQCIFPKWRWSVRCVQVTLGLGRAITSQKEVTLSSRIRDNYILISCSGLVPDYSGDWADQVDKVGCWLSPPDSAAAGQMVKYSRARNIWSWYSCYSYRLQIGTFLLVDTYILKPFQCSRATLRPCNNIPWVGNCVSWYVC